MPVKKSWIEFAGVVPLSNMYRTPDPMLKQTKNLSDRRQKKSEFLAKTALERGFAPREWLFVHSFFIRFTPLFGGHQVGLKLPGLLTDKPVCLTLTWSVSMAQDKDDHDFFCTVRDGRYIGMKNTVLDIVYPSGLGVRAFLDGMVVVLNKEKDWVAMVDTDGSVKTESWSLCKKKMDDVAKEVA